jgi:hypothetical protein
MSRFVVVAIVAALAGCVRVPVVPTSPISSFRQETSRNYTLRQRAQVNVGDSVIRVKDYYLTQISEPYFTPIESFTFLPALNLTFTQGQRYAIAGSTERAGRTWAMVRHPTEANWRILVSEGGDVHNEAVRIMTGFRGPYAINPSTAKMKRMMGEERIEASKPYTNYEIIYNGTDKASLLFTYREFSPEGLARPAFYQNLTYDAKAPIIRFKKFRIEIHSASNEGIVYTVLEDDSGK